ncbi:S1/P1 nuclease, partial [Singulisphaera rosea]
EAAYAPRFCQPGGCVVSKIDDFRRVLADPTVAPGERRKALRFLVHLVQDLHQPLHVGDRSDRGGNDLQLPFFEDGSNLHRIWDSGIVEHQTDSEKDWLLDLTKSASPDLAAQWTQGTIEDWANESFALAKVAYTMPETRVPLRPGTRLGADYQAANLPAVRERLAQSGVRVAAILNTIWK